MALSPLLMSTPATSGCFNVMDADRLAGAKIDVLANYQDLSAVRSRLSRAKPCSAQWVRNRSRASATGPSRWRARTRGYLNNVSNMPDFLARGDQVRQVFGT